LNRRLSRSPKAFTRPLSGRPHLDDAGNFIPPNVHSNTFLEEIVEHRPNGKRTDSGVPPAQGRLRAADKGVAAQATRSPLRADRRVVMPLRELGWPAKSSRLPIMRHGAAARHARRDNGTTERPKDVGELGWGEETIRLMESDLKPSPGVYGC